MDYLILLSSIVLGAFSVFWFKLDQPRQVKLLNAFTGAFLLSLTLLHLLPELFSFSPGSVSAARLGVMMLVGFYIQIALDFLSRGIEHGHAHHHDGHGHLPLGIIIGLCLHAFVEALALGNEKTYYDPHARPLLLWSIVVHNYPVSIAMLGMMLHGGLRRPVALGVLGLFAAMAPLGMLVSAHSVLASYSREMMAMVIGIFLHISTTILFEAEDIHRIHWHKLAAIIIGTALGVTSLLFA